MLKFPADSIHSEDAALDWWQNEFAAACKRLNIQVNAAALVDEMVSSIREIRAAYMDKPLSLIEASERSGYCPDHIGRLVRDGTIPNVGRPNAPKVRARDLPAKPKKKLAAGQALAYNPDADARSLVSKRR
jgi:hypothetical protein